MKITKYEKLPLDKIIIGISQARVRDVGKNIDDLARSIEKIGLIEPIVVSPTADGKYEVVTGQRRFLAVTKLNWDSITAGILSEAPSGNMAKAISLTENMVREDMPEKDYIDACTELFRHYGSIKAVSEELGLPYSRVQKYVKFDQLVLSLREKVEAGAVAIDVALRAQRAATREHEVDEEMAIALADEMVGMSSAQRGQLEKVVKSAPNSSVEEIIEAGRKQVRVKNMTIVIADSLEHALSSYAHDEGSSRDDAAIGLIIEGLAGKGYVDEV